MTPARFREGFLRIASRVKDHGDRRSIRYKRRFTGAKGIGRLAAHKLAKHLHVSSTPASETTDGQNQGVTAIIDWDLVERKETLDELPGTDAIIVNSEEIRAKAKEGTAITLTRLRRKWSAAERARFFAEVQAYNPPDVLVTPPSRQVAAPLLFQRPHLADTRSSDPGFAVKLTGDFEGGDEYWPALIQAAQWLIEIKADANDQKVQMNIVPTKQGSGDQSSYEML